MAHQPSAEAVDAPVDDMDSAAAAIAGLNLDDEPREDEETEASEEGEPEEGELDLDDEEGEQEGDETEKAPSIEAPASLNAEEKARFAQLPEEAQRMIAEVESRRNGQVQTATTKAAEAQRVAEVRAAQADAQAKAVFAQQLKVFADNLAPQRPDPSLAHTDPATYIALNAQYDAARAQHDDFVQQVTALGQQADSEMTQAEIADRDRQLLTIPEIQNEETRSAFFEKAISAAKTLGLDETGLNRATAGEWKALRQVSDWKEDAEKYRAAMSRQMQRVRDSKKAKTTKPNAAQPGSGERRGFREATQRLKQTGDLQDAAAAIARLG